MKSILLFCLFAIAGASANEPETDRYGGWKDVKGEATGWFHIEKKNGRHLLITPDGHGFVALGVNHIGAIRKAGENEPDLFAERYAGDESSFAADLERQWAGWGFNTVDDSVLLLTRRFPYLASRNFVRTAKFYSGPDGRNPYHFPDVFAPDFKDRIESEVEAFCRKHRGNRNLIAYYWTDTPTWDIRKTRTFRGTDWVTEIRKLPSAVAGRKRLGEFMRAHGGESPDNEEAFLGLIAETYYGIIGPAFREHDPNHMVFGEKYLLGDVPPQVARAAAPHLDAIAVQPGDGYIPIYTPGDTYPAEEIETLQRLTGKPVFICDHQVSFATEQYPRSIWPYHQRENEADAAAATELFLREAFARPYLLGYMRCQYITRFNSRRNASKLGLLRDDGAWHVKLADATQRANAEIKRVLREAVLHKDESD